MSTSAPTFTDIVNLLTALANNDPNIDNAPHGAFWENTTRDKFVSIKTNNWGVPGLLVAPGNPNGSNLFLALSGLAPFDGSQLPQMPDTDADPGGRHATPTQLAM